MSHWSKLYDDVLNDPKILPLSDAEYRCWITLLLLATQANEGGFIPHMNETNLILISRCNVTETLTGILEKLQVLHMVTIEEDGILLTNWEKRQGKGMSVSERVAKHRAKKAQETRKTLQKQSSNVTVTPQIDRKIDRKIDISASGAGKEMVVSEQPSLTKAALQECVLSVVEVFKIKNPNASTFVKNITQRAAIQKLVEEFGYEKTMNFAMAAVKVQGMEFAPVITTPLELLQKWNKLEAFGMKEQGKLNKPNKMIKIS